jgi:sulfonate transport system ATP-binding protein
MNHHASVVAFPRDHVLAFEEEAVIASEYDVPTQHSGGVEVRVAGLAKSFGTNQVLADIALNIWPGEFVAIVGHSGCGKSTLLRLIAGLETPTAGTINVDDRPVTGQVAAARVMFQDARLLPWRRVGANVGLGLPGNWRPSAKLALHQVGLEDRIDEWPMVLSGGQKQRVALARALVSEPKLLLLDEPLGALDALTRLEMQRLVEDVWKAQGFTAILVTHDVSEAVALADRVIVLKDGRVDLIQPVNVPRPRQRGNVALAELEGRILSRLMRRD